MIYVSSTRPGLNMQWTPPVLVQFSPDILAVCRNLRVFYASRVQNWLDTLRFDAIEPFELGFYRDLRVFYASRGQNPLHTPRLIAI